MRMMDFRGRGPIVVIGVGVALLLVLALSAVAVLRTSRADRGTRGPGLAAQAPPTTRNQVESTPTSTPGATQTDQLSQDIAGIAALPPVTAATSRRHPPIPAELRGQAALYARSFATELLTQDYRTPRVELLSWIQSESTPSSEPRVVGLVPPALRPRFAIYSLTAALDGSPTPVPSEAEWTAWSRVAGYTTVAVQQVTEPAAWSQAVAAGEITDPGVTAQDVDALVTTHWLHNGRQASATHSLSISLTLEGPPSRSDYGFVCAVTYHSVAVN